MHLKTSFATTLPENRWVDILCVTGGTVGCHNGNIRCHQRQQNWHNHNYHQSWHNHNYRTCIGPGQGIHHSPSAVGRWPSTNRVRRCCSLPCCNHWRGCSRPGRPPREDQGTPAALPGKDLEGHPRNRSLTTVGFRHSKINNALKWKCPHYGGIFGTGCTGCYQIDNSRRQWRKFRQNYDISDSV